MHDTSSSVNNSTNFSTGTNYQGVAQAAMEGGSDLQMMLGRLSDMKGKVSDAAYEAEVRKFSGAYAQEMSSFLSKQETENWSVNSETGLKLNVNADVSTDKQVLGIAAAGLTGASAGAGVGFSGGVSNNTSDATQSAQNLIANEMYNTIMNSGNMNEMMNNVSSLANNHVNTNLSDIDNAKQAIGDMAKEGANQVKGAVNDVKNAVKSIF